MTPYGMEDARDDNHSALHPAKRLKQPRASPRPATSAGGASSLLSVSSNRISLDVGGTKFITSASTLTSNSMYFASLLSDNWWNRSREEETDNNDDTTYFLDQDPIPFRVLLAYMRRGIIKITDIDTDVLVLAEFLGMERLLLGVKVRWYNNIGRGPVHLNDEDIAAAFDVEHGGIIRAISSGLFPYFLKPNVDAKKDLAAMIIWRPDDNDLRTHTISIKEVKKEAEDDTTTSGNMELAGCLIGALNGLHLKGYTVHEHHLDKSNRYEEIMTYSRKRHHFRYYAGKQSDATDVFIPSLEEEKDQTCQNDQYTKQFAMLLEETDQWQEITLAPAALAPQGSGLSPEDISDPFGVVRFDGRGSWLESNGFLTREERYEGQFRGYIKSLLKFNFPKSRRDAFRVCRIYSRRVKRQEREGTGIRVDE